MQQSKRELDWKDKIQHQGYVLHLLPLKAFSASPGQYEGDRTHLPPAKLGVGVGDSTQSLVITENPVCLDGVNSVYKVREKSE